MARYCEVENTIIKNVFVADEAFVNEHKPYAISCPDFVGVGDKYEGGVFERVVIVAPTPEEPVDDQSQN